MLYIQSLYEELYKSKTVSYTGEDAAQKFVDMLMKDIKVIATLPDKEMEELTEEEQDYYDNATTCWICDEKFTKTRGA